MEIGEVTTLKLDKLCRKKKASETSDKYFRVSIAREKLAGWSRVGKLSRFFFNVALLFIHR